jgi:hypothetical protein
MRSKASTSPSTRAVGREASQQAAQSAAAPPCEDDADVLQIRQEVSLLEIKEARGAEPLRYSNRPPFAAQPNRVVPTL